MNLKQINISAYNYSLPDESIAKYPLAKRDESKLLVFKNEEISEDVFKNISEYLPENSLVVANNTKVIKARLEFIKTTGARIEVFCLEPHLPADYNIAFASNNSCEWICIVGNLKKWKNGRLEKLIQIENENATLIIERKGSQNDSHIIIFQWDNPAITFSDIIDHYGNIPIPPYLNRKAETSDLTAYQTIYSKHKGSVAAPTAGLHFTNDVFASLKNKNIEHHEVTLHVGAGTFKPVKAEIIGDHEMHTEHFIITPQTIPPLLKYLGNITAVGTTTVRTLESLYWLGVKHLQNNLTNKDDFHIKQWEVYDLAQNVSVYEALNCIHEQIINTKEGHINASTAIMIVPGYQFKVVNRLITNFHQPQSTLLLLISAFVGDNWKKIYDYALSKQFRFLSYGDSCFLDNKKRAI